MMSILFLDGNNIDDVEVDDIDWLVDDIDWLRRPRPAIKCNPNKLVCCRMANFSRIDSILHGVRQVAKWKKPRWNEEN